MKNSFVLLLICTLFGSMGLSQTLKDERYLGGNPQFSAAKTNFEFTEQTRPKGQYDNYGGKFGIGIGISFFNALGAPLRYYFSPKIVMEGGIYYGLIHTTDDYGVPDGFEDGLMLGGGFTFFGDRFEKESMKKIKAHGLALRYNYFTGNYLEANILSAGWAMETFKKDRSNRSFIFELGLKTTLSAFEIYPNIPVYLRCHWNFFVK